MNIYICNVIYVKMEHDPVNKYLLEIWKALIISHPLTIKFCALKWTIFFGTFWLIVFYLDPYPGISKFADPDPNPRSWNVPDPDPGSVLWKIHFKHAF